MKSEKLALYSKVFELVKADYEKKRKGFCAVNFIKDTLTVT